MTDHDEKLKLLRDVLGSYHKTGHEYLFKCPNPNCEHRKQKLSVNIDKNVFKCWICDFKGSNIKRLVRRYGTFLQKQKWNETAGEIDLSVSLDSFFKPIEEERHEILKLPKEFISLCNKEIPLSGLEAKRYLSSRGIDKTDVLRWKIGYAKDGKYGNRIIVPSFDNGGNVNYFVARSYTDEWNKYSNPATSKDLVFNELYIDWNNDLVLVEGVFDAIKAGNAIPLLGSTLQENSKMFQEITKHDTPLYIALDPDAEKKAFNLIKSFLLYDVEIYKIDVSGYIDVGEMTKEEFQKRKKNAQPINSETYVESMFQWRI